MVDLSFCSLADRRTAYRRSGQGEGALLVHGITSNSFVWREIVPRLSESFDVISIDLQGCGGSDLSLDADYSIAAQAESTAGFIRALYHRELLDDELMALFWDQMSTGERRRAFLKLARSLNNEQLLAIEDDLRDLDLPTLILRGDADIYLSATICERLHSDIAGSRLERINTGGHFLQLDEPDWVVEHLLGFLPESSR